MSQDKINFNNGTNYEKLMGAWSELVGSVFLDWLDLPNKLEWLDVGCGNGDFTEMVIKRYSPEAISGMDPSAEQLSYARSRPGCELASFRLGNANNLPYSNNQFDVAVMALSIFFVPEPAKGLSEMIRVVRPGGSIAAYVWDMLDNLYPLAPINQQLSAMGMQQLLPPSLNSSKLAVLQNLWTQANLKSIEMDEFIVKKTFNNFEDYWSTALLDSSIKTIFNSMTLGDQKIMINGVCKSLPMASNGQIIVTAKANAVRGQVSLSD
jgi:ubiquinone/menaquinone biosynthesis C-methylase UbiE